MPVSSNWTDDEINTFTRRVALLKKGMDEVEAERLAEEMLRRDRPESGDDRRLCLECSRFRKGRCSRGMPALPTILQRCDTFAMRGAA